MSIHRCRFVLLLVICQCTDISSQLATSQIDSLVNQLGLAKEDSNKVNLLMQIGNEIGYTDLNAALNYALQGYELSEQIDFLPGMGRLSYLAGISYMDLGDFVMADSFLDISQDIFEQLRDSRNLGKISNALGNRNYLAGNYVLAANNYSDAASIFDELNDTTSSILVYQNLVAVLGQIKQHEKAAALGRNILVRIKNSNDTLQLGYTLQGLTNDLIYANKTDEASLYIPQLQVIGQKTQDQNLSAEIFSTLGTYYYHLKDYQEAIKYFETAKNKAEKLDHKFQVANHLNSLGNCYLETGNLQLAKDYFFQSDSLAVKHNIKSIEAKISLSLSKLYQVQNQYQNAYIALQRYTTLIDSLLSSEVRNQTMQLQTQFETNKKDREISHLQQMQMEKDFAIGRRNTYLSFGGGIILLLCGSIYLLIGIHRNRQDLNKQQTILLEEKVKTIEKEQQITSLQSMINGQESERTRIARDLHDGLGGLLSTVKMHYTTLTQNTPSILQNKLYQKTLDLINNAADELRKVAHNMMPEVLMKLGLAEAIREFCNNITAGKSLLITFQAFGMEKRLCSSTEIMIYRIVQELVQNIIKHARASEAIIQINRDHNRLSLIIEDNGCGFNLKEAGAKNGMGLETVKSRVAYLNGHITVDSRKDIGTTIMIDFFIKDET